MPINEVIAAGISWTRRRLKACKMVASYLIA